jgi:hypothetical protein
MDSYVPMSYDAILLTAVEVTALNILRILLTQVDRYDVQDLSTSAKRCGRPVPHTTDPYFKCRLGDGSAAKLHEFLQPLKKQFGIMLPIMSQLPLSASFPIYMY